MEINYLIDKSLVIGKGLMKSSACYTISLKHMEMVKHIAIYILTLVLSIIKTTK